MRDCRLVVSHTFPSVWMSEPDWRLKKKVCIFRRPLAIWCWSCFTPTVDDLPFKCQVSPPESHSVPCRLHFVDACRRKTLKTFAIIFILFRPRLAWCFFGTRFSLAVRKIDEKKSILRTPDDVEKAPDECELFADTHAHSCCFHFTMERFSLLKTSSWSAFPETKLDCQGSGLWVLRVKGATAVIDEQKFSCFEFCERESEVSRVVQK